MRKIFQYILMAVAVVATASCSNEQDEPMQPAHNGTLQFVVSDFPAFGEDPETRAIGTQDAGKTEWEAGDEIIVEFYSSKYKSQWATLIYDGSKWNLKGSLLYLENETPAVRAYYAPCYEVAEVGLMQFRNGMLSGMTEYLLSEDCLVENSTISISFEDVTRDYSRLRIVGLAGQTYTVTTTDFTPAAATSEATEAYTLTADDKGNAYLYGTFAEGATVTVKQDEVTLASYPFTAETEHGKSYALNALGYDYDEGTNTYTVCSSIGLSVWNEAVQAILSSGSDGDGDGLADYSEALPNLTLTADITLTGENNWTPLGYETDDNVCYGYTGTIDGNGYKITGLNINSTDSDIAFVAVLGRGGEVKNLTFENATITGKGYVATVVANNYYGKVMNCHVTGSSSVSGQYSYVGGVLAYNMGGVIIGCINSGNVSSDSKNIGGVVGINDGIMIACGNAGEVSSGQNVGGIAGGIDSYGSTYASWTKETNECKGQTDETSKDGFGYNNGTVTTCFIGDATTVNTQVDAMNTAITNYNASAAEGKKCPYKWQAGVDGGWPTLVSIE